MSSDREQFKTRLGFLLIAAGCAIGLGNVWRFPYITGMYGGALFVIIYLAFLLCVGMPLLTIELAIGRASRRSIARAYEVLEKPKSKWHLNKFWQIPGSYILSTAPGGGFEFLTGTSMAAPMVTGVCAMVYSYRTDLGLLKVKEAVLSTAKKLEGLTDKVKSGGIPDLYAAMEYGRE